MNRTQPILLSCIALLAFTGIASGAVLKKSGPTRWTEANRILMPFAENKGQIEDPNVLFYSNTFACQVSVNKDGTIGYRVADGKPGKAEKQHIIRERIGIALKTAPVGENKAAARVSHFSGRDPKKWITDIVSYNTVDMGEVYQGIRLKLQARSNNVEKIFHVRPSANPENIRMRIEGAQALKLTPRGELEVHTGGGWMRFSKPVAYQTGGGRKTSVDVAYTVAGDAYGFQVGDYDKTKVLIIDPLITAIFHGTSDKATQPTCMAADSEGNIYVAGKTDNRSVIFKFDRKLKKLLRSVFVGAKNQSDIYDIAVDSQNAIYVAGRTSDKAFPIKEGAFDSELSHTTYSWEAVDGFVIKYNSELNDILASTFIGAAKADVAYGLAVDGADNVYVVGETTNPVYDPDGDIAPFPTTPGAFDTTYGSRDKTKAFVAHLDSKLQNLLASTLLGDNGDDDQLNDVAKAVAIDRDGNVVVAGRTQSLNFPVTAKCADPKFEGKWEAFAAKFDPDLKNLLASTFLGGADEEKVNAVAIDANNEIVLAGWTLSSDFPVAKDNFDTSYHQLEDGFVSRLNSELTAIIASTYIGGQGADQVSHMVLHEDGRVVICGGTGSIDFPATKDSQHPVINFGNTEDFYEGNGFLTILDRNLTIVEASTFLGGLGHDYVSAVVINKEDIVLVGETSSENFPYMTENQGGSEAFVCRFNKDEEPDPLPAAGPGYWQSKVRGTVSRIYLDIDICKDGSFSGLWQGYFCIPVGIVKSCRVREGRLGPNPVSGTIDFNNSTGTINIGDDCKELPFLINKQTPDELHIVINPGKEKCLGGFISRLHYQGESETGKCGDDAIATDKDKDKDEDKDKDKDKDKDESTGSGGGGGGCFINMISDAL